MVEGVSGVTPAAWVTPGDTPVKEEDGPSSEVNNMPHHWRGSRPTL